MKYLNLLLKYPFRFVIFFSILLVVASCSTPNSKYPQIKIETDLGDIVIELYADKAPITANAFLSYVDSGLYSNSSFYRVLKSEDQPSSSFKSDIIQGGIWEANNAKAVSLKGIRHENTQQTGLLHKTGTISLARTTPGTATSEFFICLGDQPVYDFGGDANPDKQGFAAFGKVIRGMEVVEAIHKQPDYEGTFKPAIRIVNVKRL